MTVYNEWACQSKFHEGDPNNQPNGDRLNPKDRYQHRHEWLRLDGRDRPRSVTTHNVCRFCIAAEAEDARGIVPTEKLF